VSEASILILCCHDVPSAQVAFRAALAFAAILYADVYTNTSHTVWGVLASAAGLVLTVVLLLLVQVQDPAGCPG
jgi:hypothetical protein